MGCCQSSLTPEEEKEIAQSRKYDLVQEGNQKEEVKTIRLLLLGTGESGKTTIFKQMAIINEKVPFSDIDVQNFRQICRKNAVEAMQTLVVAVNTKFNFTWTDEKAQETSQRLAVVEPLQSDFWSEELIPMIQLLWKEKVIQDAYARRSELQLLDSAAYMFENVERIGAKDFRPTQEDILRARFRTSGIVEKTHIINDVPFKFLDVGGQRNERRKWLHCFEDVTAIIFVTAISEYDQLLYEDEKVNRLHESLKVFESILANRFFSKTTVILFMNKIDLFIEKLKTKSITTAFPDYDGNGGVEDASDYIEKQFLAKNVVKKDQKQRRLIFPYFTCATDTGNVSKVFDACKATILDANLRRLGLG